MKMGDEVKLINAMEIIVNQALKSYLNSLHLNCTCNRCQLDVMALALNSLPSKYVVTDLGIPYAKAQYMTDQYQANVLTALAEAATIVNEKKSHD